MADLDESDLRRVPDEKSFCSGVNSPKVPAAASAVAAEGLLRQGGEAAS